MDRRSLLSVLALAGLGACGLAKPAAQPQAVPAPEATLQPPAPTAAVVAVPRQGAPLPSVVPTSVPTQAPNGWQAPELLGGGPWLNSEPLTLAGLRGKVVAVDFWTYGCINCVRTLPYVQAWWEQFKDAGLVIIGVHSPEFDREHDLANVRAASERLGVTWPVVQDNDFRIWRAYRNRYWPHLYLVDKAGYVVYDHIGEGAYDETERRIAEALKA